MSMPAVRIVKIGGSLFDYAQLAEAWCEWLSRQPQMKTVIIGGGGLYANLVREWDQQFGLGEEAAHWMCVASMNVTAALLHHRLPGVSLIDDWQSLGEWLASSQMCATTVFSVESFLKTIEKDMSGDSLPRTWAVSSDSIAARGAETVEAEELVLGKSTSVSSASDWQQRSDEGFVDRHFPEIVTRLPAVRWVNLRSITAAKTPLTT